MGDTIWYALGIPHRLLHLRANLLRSWDYFGLSILGHEVSFFLSVTNNETFIIFIAPSLITVKKLFRFKSKLVRCIASFSYVIRSLLNLAVTVFTPCVALKAVIGLPYWASIIGIVTISVIFTLMVCLNVEPNRK